MTERVGRNPQRHTTRHTHHTTRCPASDTRKRGLRSDPERTTPHPALYAFYVSGVAARATEPPSTPRATARPPCLQESYALPSATLYRAQLAPEHSGTSRMTGTRSETNATGHTTTRPAPQRPGNHDRLPERGRGQLRSSATRPQRRAARHRAAALDPWGNPSLLRQRPDTGTQWGYQAVTISLTGLGSPPRPARYPGAAGRRRET